MRACERKAVEGQEEPKLVRQRQDERRRSGGKGQGWRSRELGGSPLSLFGEKERDMKNKGGEGEGRGKGRAKAEPEAEAEEERGSQAK
jgi:hypothetical protein